MKIFNKIKIIIFMIILLFILTGCTYTIMPDEYKVNNEIFGTITDKFLVPHRDITEYKTVNGEYVPIEKHTVDKYYFEISRKEKHSTYKTNIEVSKEIYEKYGIGDFYGGE